MALVPLAPFEFEIQISKKSLYAPEQLECTSRNSFEITYAWFTPTNFETKPLWSVIHWKLFQLSELKAININIEFYLINAIPLQIIINCLYMIAIIIAEIFILKTLIQLRLLYITLKRFPQEFYHLRITHILTQALFFSVTFKMLIIWQSPLENRAVRHFLIQLMPSPSAPFPWRAILPFLIMDYEDISK